MKKLMLVMVAVAFSSTVSAQNFNAGISAGFPSGDASDFSTFAIAVDLGYIFEVSDNLCIFPRILSINTLKNLISVCFEIACYLRFSSCRCCV